MGSFFRTLVLMLAAFVVGAQDTGPVEKLGNAIPPDLMLLDEAGRPVNLGSLIRQPTILTLNYFRCAGICTPQLNGLVEALKDPALEPGKSFQIITVSFDPRDTPAIAAGKRANYLRALGRPMPPEAWRFLTGDARATRALADAVGFRFEKAGEGFTHSAVLIFLSPAGRVTHYRYGVSFQPLEIREAIQEAARAQARSTHGKWMSVCYAPASDGREPVISPARVGACLALLVALVLGGFLLFRRLG